MIQVKYSKEYYEKLFDWLYDIDKDHMDFIDALKDLYKAYTGQDVDFYLPLIAKLIPDEPDWEQIMLWNYRIHLSIYQIMEQLGSSLSPPIVVIPKILKASSEEDAITKEYFMHRDIEQFILSLGGG